jgi:molybdopterin molybdotransferase
VKKFLPVSDPEKFRAFAGGIEPLGEETVRLAESLGRVISRDMESDQDLPPFRRSVMDGYAVMALNTTGASSSSPAYLNITGEILIGHPPPSDIGPGECCRIPTGGMMPDSADAVVMVEYARELPGGTVEMATSVAPGENVADIGEDIARGQMIVNKGRVVRPQEVGVLAGLGILEVTVFRRVEVGILSTGDELVEPNEKPGPGQIRNINQYSLMSQIKALGGRPHLLGIAPDDPREIRKRVEEGLGKSDMVLISGGSSVGTRDLTARIIDDLGPPGVIFHGVSVRPGKPTILGQAGEKVIFGLPGHPVSAMVSFLNFVRPVILSLSGLAEDDPARPLPAVLGDNIHSRPGREDYVQVALSNSQEGVLRAMPIFKKSGMVTAMAMADGFIVIPSEAEGLEAGESVLVHLYRSVLR